MSKYRTIDQLNYHFDEVRAKISVKKALMNDFPP